jgi:hypothetical protein
MMIREGNKKILPEDSYKTPLNDGRKKSLPFIGTFTADAKTVSVADDSIDLIFTSPAYWQKRNYEIKGQIGWENSPQEYADIISEIINNWKRIIKKTG